MTRDMELVRSILLLVESSDVPPSMDDVLGQLPERKSEEVAYHLKMMIEQVGFLNAISVGAIEGDSWIDLELTWSGHEFLEAVRDPEVWRRTKEGAQKAGNAGLGFMWELAKAYAKHVAKERLGIDKGSA
jgi:hypothetical protein